MDYTNKFNKYKTVTTNSLSKVDSFFRKESTGRVFFICVILISFALIYVLNILHPLFGDDWMYSMLPDGHTRIHSFKDILYTQYKHYFTWGGRTVVHIIAQSLLLSGTKAADFINSLAYIAFTLVIYYLADGFKTLRPSLLIGINFLIWFFQPAFGSTVLWITGSANYLWGTLILFLFLIPYIKLIREGNTDSSILKCLLMFLFGIIAGWTNENMSVALIIMLIVCMIYTKVSFSRIPLWTIYGLVGATIGGAFMIAAPGNYARMDVTLSNDLVTHSIWYIYFERFFAAITSYYYYVLSTTFVVVFLFFLHQKYKIRSEQKTALFLFGLFFVGGIIATLAMSAAPIFPGRASFGINSLLFVAATILFANLDFRKSLIRNLTYTTIIFGLLLFIVDYTRSYRVLREVDKHYQARVAVIDRGKAMGETNFILYDRINPQNKALHYFELGPDSTNWHNQMYSGYYQINSIIVK